LRHPPYHLRLNKAVDRLTLIDAIKHIGRSEDLRAYTYYGMGGPTLEDFRLIYEFFPEIRMVCIEENEDTYKRQRFHLPCRSRRLKLERTAFSSFLAKYEAKDERSIFWLDYLDLQFTSFEEFMELLGKVGAKSVVKITLRCNPPDFLDPDTEKQLKKQEEFKKKFETVLPSAFTVPPIELKDLAQTVQEMLQIASQKALPSRVPTMFLPVSSFFYNDGTGMFTLTGVVCLRTSEAEIKSPFANWRFANLKWNAPIEINVPNLSTKERLHLQRHLPHGRNAGKILRRSLGYLIDRDQAQTESQLQQYADFHRYSPYFIKAIP
jgi:hypothetical protein